MFLPSSLGCLCQDSLSPRTFPQSPLSSVSPISVCAISLPLKRTRDLEAVALVEELLAVFQLGVEVVRVDAGDMRISLTSITR